MNEPNILKIHLIKAEKRLNYIELEYTWEFIIDNQNISIIYIHNLKSKVSKILLNQKLIKEEKFYQNNYTYEFHEKGHNYKIVHENGFPSLYIDGKYIKPLDFLQDKKDYETPSQNPNLCNYINNNNNYGNDNYNINYYQNNNYNNNNYGNNNYNNYNNNYGNKNKNNFNNYSNYDNKNNNNYNNINNYHNNK